MNIQQQQLILKELKKKYTQTKISEETGIYLIALSQLNKYGKSLSAKNQDKLISFFNKTKIQQPPTNRKWKEWNRNDYDTLFKGEIPAGRSYDQCREALKRVKKHLMLKGETEDSVDSLCTQIKSKIRPKKTTSEITNMIYEAFLASQKKII